MKKTKDYIKGFKHGTRWAGIWIIPSMYKKITDYEVKQLRTNFDKGIKEAIKSLKEER
jgi:hypothetical protein